MNYGAAAWDLGVEKLAATRYAKEGVKKVVRFKTYVGKGGGWSARFNEGYDNLRDLAKKRLYDTKTGNTMRVLQLRKRSIARMPEGADRAREQAKLDKTIGRLRDAARRPTEVRRTSSGIDPYA